MTYILKVWLWRFLIPSSVSVLITVNNNTVLFHLIDNTIVVNPQTKENKHSVLRKVTVKYVLLVWWRLVIKFIVWINHKTTNSMFQNWSLCQFKETHLIFGRLWLSHLHRTDKLEMLPAACINKWENIYKKTSLLEMFYNSIKIVIWRWLEL